MTSGFIVSLHIDLKMRNASFKKSSFVVKGLCAAFIPVSFPSAAYNPSSSGAALHQTNTTTASLMCAGMDERGGKKTYDDVAGMTTGSPFGVPGVACASSVNSALLSITGVCTGVWTSLLALLGNTTPSLSALKLALLSLLLNPTPPSTPSPPPPFPSAGLHLPKIWFTICVKPPCATVWLTGSVLMRKTL